jgi:hypothetical protein
VKTYSTTGTVTSTSRAVLSVLVLAGSGEVALDLDGSRIGNVSRWCVSLDRQPRCSTTGANAEVDGRIVAKGLARAAPLAGLTGTVPRRVEVVLGGRRLALPHVIVCCVGAGERLSCASLDLCWDGLGLGTWVVGTADSNDRAGVVLCVNIACAFHAEAGRKC